MTVRNLPLTLLAMFAVFYVLFIGKALIIPFVIAVLFWFALVSLTEAFQKAKIPYLISLLLSFGTYFLFFWFVIEVINQNINQVIELAPSYEERIRTIMVEQLAAYDIALHDSVNYIFKGLDVSLILTTLAASILDLFSKGGIVLIYTAFLLLEYKGFANKIRFAFPAKKSRDNINRIISVIKEDIKSYFAIKAFASFLTAFLSFIVLSLFGVDFTMFWTFIIFLLNFIPTVGSIVAVIFPVLLSVVQFEQLYMFVFVLISLMSVQILVGNFIDPKMMGNKLNLSPLAILLSLAFWGSLWGVVGMLLSVPIMVSLNIILSEFKSTRPISVLISEKGRLTERKKKKANSPSKGEKLWHEYCIVATKGFLSGFRKALVKYSRKASK